MPEHIPEFSGVDKKGRKLEGFGILTILLQVFLTLSACHVFSYEEQSTATGMTGEEHSARVNDITTMNKVDREVRVLIDRIANVDPVTSNGKSAALSALSTPTLRVDDLGRIQLHVYVSAVDVDMRKLLNEAGAEIELENQELKVYQAWIPAAAVQTIATLETVRKVIPPSYASYR